MILAEKIIKLRKQQGWSQEELAMKLGISRQSVSKWESTASIPDLDKIIKLSELFGVSMDYLLKDSEDDENVVAYPDENVLENSKDEKVHHVTLEEANIYMTLIEHASSRIAAGVAMCILCPIPLLLLTGLSEMQGFAMSENMAGGIGVTVLLLMVAVAVAIFIANGMQMDKYDYLEKEVLSLEYGVSGIVEMKKENFEPTHKQCIVIGVGLCITSAVPLLLAAGFEASDSILLYCVCLLLGFVAFGVFLFVWSGMIWGSYQKLLEEGDYTRKKKLENKKNDNLSMVYWSIVITIYLGYSFYTFNWHISWIIWPCAGVLFAAVLGVAAMVRRK